MGTCVSPRLGLGFFEGEVSIGWVPDATAPFATPSTGKFVCRIRRLVRVKGGGVGG